MEIVLFQVRTRPDIDQAAYQEAFEHMLGLVAQLPGFVGIDGYAGEDGRELAVARFDSPEAVVAWRDHPEHVATRRRGREQFFAAYDITVATVSREYGWATAAAEDGGTAPAAPDSGATDLARA